MIDQKASSISGFWPNNAQKYHMILNARCRVRVRGGDFGESWVGAGGGGGG